MTSDEDKATRPATAGKGPIKDGEGAGIQAAQERIWAEMKNEHGDKPSSYLYLDEIKRIIFGE